MKILRQGLLDNMPEDGKRQVLAYFLADTLDFMIRQFLE